MLSASAHFGEYLADYRADVYGVYGNRTGVDEVPFFDEDMPLDYVDPRTVERWFTGECLPTREVFQRILEEIEAPLADMLHLLALYRTAEVERGCAHMRDDVLHFDDWVDDMSVLLYGSEVKRV